MDAGARQQALLGALHHHRAGAPAPARALCQRVLAHEPAQADALHLLGLIEWRDGALERGTAALRRAVSVDPFSAVRPTLAAALAEGGREAEAARALRAALALAPSDVQVWATAAHGAVRRGRPAEALAAWRIVAALCPDRPAVYAGLAGALRDAGRPAGALEAGRRAVALGPGQASLYADLALMFEASVDVPGAVAAYRRAIRLDPGLVEAHVNLALRLLHLGDLAAGWEEYAWRLAQDARTPRQTLPAWRGDGLAGRRLLVWGEQGIGDEVMFASCLPDVMAAAERVTVLCEPRLVPLFARSFPGAAVGPLPGDGDTDGDAGFATGDEVQAAIGSLPRWLRPARDSFPRRRGYLTADPRETERLRGLLSGDGEPAVGVAWHTAAETQRCVSLADLADALPGARLVSVQHGDHEGERASVEARLGREIRRVPEVDPLADLDRYAALLAALDLVVTIDNSTAHLAGALGVPTWILLPSPPNWRWFGGRHGCPWYPQARLFLQDRPGDWGGVLRAVAAELRRFAGRPGS